MAGLFYFAGASLALGVVVMLAVLSGGYLLLRLSAAAVRDRRHDE